MEAWGLAPSSEGKPDSISCEKCGKDKPMTQIDHPFSKQKRWVHCACPCQIKKLNDFKEEQSRKAKQIKIERMLKISSELNSIKSLTFTNFVDRKGTDRVKQFVLDAVNNFEERERKGLFIFGETGNGKTHLTAAGGNELIKKGYAVIFITEQDLFKRLDATKNFKNEESFNEIMNACIGADLLIWDDFLSSQTLNKDERNYIFQVVNGRERANKPIWFTSNVSEREFSNDSTAYRLDDKGRTWWRIIGNSDCVMNTATNRRKSIAMAQALGISVEDYENGNYQR